MITGFQKYLIDNGFKRFCTTGVGDVKEDYESVYLSSYNPLQYDFYKNGKYYCYWGLSEKDKPPVMCLGLNRMRVILTKEQKFRTYEDGYRILFSKWGEDKYPEILEVLYSDDKYFCVDCRDENDIKITINQKPNLVRVMN